jgi:hypothetical protein
MKFAMYVVDVEDGHVSGTNDSDVVRQLCESGPERYVIIHATYGDFQALGEEAQPIEELGGEDEEEEDVDESDNGLNFEGDED